MLPLQTENPRGCNLALERLNNVYENSDGVVVGEAGEFDVCERDDVAGGHKSGKVEDTSAKEDEKAGDRASGVAIICVVFNEIVKDPFYPALVCKQGITS